MPLQASGRWALGDSLTDDGNLNRFVFAVATDFAPTSHTVGAPAYYQTGGYFTGLDGSFSNGPTFAEYVAADFSAAGRATGNFARGGAEAAEADSILDPTPGLERQRGELLAQAGSFGARPLVSLLAGANDIFDGLKSATPDLISVQAAQAAADAVIDTARIIARGGAGDFLIANLPDIGRTPAYARFQPGLSAAATAATRAFNDRLATNVATLRGEGVRVVELDLFGVLNDILDDPAAAGFSDVRLPCIFPTAAVAGVFGQTQYCSANQAEGRLFFDGVHPNFLAHRQVGARVLSTLEASLVPAPVPLGGTLPLMAGGVMVLVAVRRRQREASATSGEGLRAA